jgi:hypothetical protein
MLGPAVEWNPGAYLEAAAVAAPRVQLAAEDAHALAHADESVAAAAHARRRHAARPAVADVQLDVLYAKDTRTSVGVAPAYLIALVIASWTTR